MSPENETRFQNRFAVNKLRDILILIGAFDELMNVLSNEDLRELENNNIYFAGFYAPAGEFSFTPASLAQIRFIVLEIHTLRKFISSEVVAIILHEIGHALAGNRDENVADSYACSRGLKRYLLSGLRRGLELKLEGFSSSDVMQRVEYINLNYK